MEDYRGLLLEITGDYWRITGDYWRITEDYYWRLLEITGGLLEDY